jgi:hypothetical protein
MTYRKIVIVGETWQYFVGESNIVFIKPDGKKFSEKVWTVAGVDANIFGRGQWKRTDDGMLRPAKIRRYILENFYLGVTE